MRRLVVPCLLLAGLLLTASRVAAEEAKKETPADPAKAAALVQKLADNSFEVREDAHKRLEVLGKAAVPALEDGVKDYDLEVSSRCKRLLALATRTEIEVALDAFLADKDTKLILKLPSYERYKKVVGDDQNARALFVEMYSLEGGLLAELERDPKKFETMFTNRCQQIQQTLYTPLGQANHVPMGQMVALLFAATDSRVSMNINSFYQFTNLLYHPSVKQGFTSNTGARKLLVQYFEQQTDQNTMGQAIQLAVQLELREMAPVALKAATNKNQQPWTRATALMAVGKFGTKDDIKQIEPLLEDATNVGTMQFNQVRVTTEVRDAALAAMILLSGQDVMSYNFPYLRAFPNININRQFLAYNYFGFSDNDQRAAALKQYKEAVAKQEKKDDKKEQPKGEKK
jgi:hypothetical protein